MVALWLATAPDRTRTVRLFARCFRRSGTEIPIQVRTGHCSRSAASTRSRSCLRCIGKFLRAVTHPKLFDPAFTASEAMSAIGQILDSRSLIVLYPGAGFLDLLGIAIEEAGSIGNLIFYTQIVASVARRESLRFSRKIGTSTATHSSLRRVCNRIGRLVDHLRAGRWRRIADRWNVYGRCGSAAR